MKSKIFKSVLRKDVVSKIAVFADVFNLSITSWRIKDIDEHTHRFEFFSKNTPVGYIDAITSDISPDYPETDMPFTLYTPIGKVTGHYSTHFEEFKYEVAKREKEFEKFDGLFKVQSTNNNGKEDYIISSHMDLETLDGTKNKVVFNSLAGSYQVEIERSGNGDSETARAYYNSGDLCVDHFHYPNFNDREYFSKIRMELEENQDKHQISYEFKGQVPYTKEIELPVKRYLPGWRKMELLDYSMIDEDIALFDERLLNFIDEVKNDLYLLANGVEPISIYDKLAQLCFHRETDRFKLGFSRAREISTVLDTDKVLRKSKEETSSN